MTEVIRAEGSFVGAGSDGPTISWRCWLPQERPPTRLFVISHGFAEHGGCYDQLGQAFAAQGCAVYAADHRGHGRSGGERGQIERLSLLGTDLATMVAEARRRHPGLPLTLFGHSMGGALAVKHVLENPGDADQLALCGPGLWFDHMPPPVQWLVHRLASVMPRLPVLRVLPLKLTSDPGKARDVADDPLSYHGWAPMRLAGEMLALSEELRGRFSELNLPVLIQHGSEDRLTRLRGSELAIERIGSASKSLIVYKGLRHNLFKEMERGRMQALGDLAGWMVNPLAPSDLIQQRSF